MRTEYAILTSIGVCAFAAALEGLCAGKNVKSFFGTLRFPRFSAPLWAWSVIGGAYYLIFGFVIYRVLRLESSVIRSAALALVFFMMIVNALTNYIIFRTRNLHQSFIVGSLFPVMDVALLICLLQLDTLAAWLLAPYLIYRVYAVWWGYALWKINRPVSSQNPN
ncbi:MAG TPA: TspO/MBR family protein [Pyrinomonadaceae bacterium]|nr:TspO/MBR family protein [Pyrinomonadaceae bacterium]